MAQYRLATLDLSTRVQVTLEMLAPRAARGWGRVTALAAEHQISRTLLYAWRDRGQAAILAALAPQAPGPQPAATTVTVDAAFIQQAIAILATQRGTVRGIQQGLALLFQAPRSVGYISQTLTTLGAQAARQNAALRVPLPVLAEADEIFQGRQPCLTVVDGRSFLVLNLAPADVWDATTWGVTFLDLQARGIQFQDLASDGGTGIRAGAAAAQLAVPLRPDLFHLLDDAWRVGQRLERQAYQAMQVAERARRADQEAQAAQRRRGPRLKVTVPLVEAVAQEAQAIQTYDLFVWLLGEVRQVLEPLSARWRPDGGDYCAQHRRNGARAPGALAPGAHPSPGAATSHAPGGAAGTLGLAGADAGAVSPEPGPSHRNADPVGLATSADAGVDARRRLPDPLAGDCAGLLDRIELLPSLVQLGGIFAQLAATLSGATSRDAAVAAAFAATGLESPPVQPRQARRQHPAPTGWGHRRTHPGAGA